MPEERMWNVIHYPYTEGSGNTYTENELERSANYDYELGIGGQSEFEQRKGKGKFQAESDWAKVTDEEELKKWRHRKGEGCESWLDQSKLDPNRTTCVLCDLPWAEDLKREWAFAAEHRPRSAGFRTPVNYRGRSSSKKDGQPSSVLPSTSANIAIRGGADAEPAYCTCSPSPSRRTNPSFAFASSPSAHRNAETNDPPSREAGPSQQYIRTTPTLVGLQPHATSPTSTSALQAISQQWKYCAAQLTAAAPRGSVQWWRLEATSWH